MISVNISLSTSFRLAAALCGIVGTVLEGFIGTATLLSGYGFGLYDVVGIFVGLRPSGYFGAIPSPRQGLS